MIIYIKLITKLLSYWWICKYIYLRPTWYQQMGQTRTLLHENRRWSSSPVTWWKVFQYHRCDEGVLACPNVFSRQQCANYKQLLDEVFVISRIIKVEVGVISRSRRLRLITLTETKKKLMFLLLHWLKSKTKRANLTWLPLKIMHRGHTPWPWHDYPWPWHDNFIIYRRWFRKLTVRFWPIR